MYGDAVSKLVYGKSEGRVEGWRERREGSVHSRLFSIAVQQYLLKHVPVV